MKVDDMDVRLATCKAEQKTENIETETRDGEQLRSAASFYICVLKSIYILSLRGVALVRISLMSVH